MGNFNHSVFFVKRFLAADNETPIHYNDRRPGSSRSSARAGGFRFEKGAGSFHLQLFLGISESDAIANGGEAPGLRPKGG